MAEIKNGILKGVVPEKALFAVNYPGYPASLPRAIETLGGKEALVKARSSETNYIELRFRPEDPYAHPAFGELRGFSGLLLELSMLEDQKKDVVVRGKVTAKVDQAYEFGGLADYQYIAPSHVKLEKGRKRRRLQDLFSENTGGKVDTEEEEMMILPPPLFSVKDVPEELVLQPSELTRASQRKALLCQQPWEMDIDPCFCLDFKIREIPSKVNWEEHIHPKSPEWPIQSALAKLFEERPIWAKPTVNERLIEQGFIVTDLHLRRLLFRLSYYFAYGPFRMLWIRKGYDPRKDPDSRKFQMMDFRLPKTMRKAAQALRENDEVASISWRDICSFKKVPDKKFSFLQLYDLEDAYVQEQINRPPEQTVCNEHAGWFKRSSIVRIRQHIRVQFLSLIPGDLARGLEQIESKKLEGLKRFDLIRQSCAQMAVTNEALPLDERLNQGGVENFFDEEEEDDDEEEEEEEEDDDYQSLEELDFADNSQVDNYGISFDSIPKSYLQELLEKFPANASDNAEVTRHVDLSDEEEEYAIYEQEEDDDDDFDD